MCLPLLVYITVTYQTRRQVVMLVTVLWLCLGHTLAQNGQDLDSVGTDNYDYRSYAQPHETKPISFPRNDEDPAETNYPVKTVQRFKDEDGNVKVLTSYSKKNEDQPIYKPLAAQVSERRAPAVEYSAIKSVRFPTRDGNLYSDQQESIIRGGSATNYNHGNSYDSRSKPIHVPHIENGQKEITQPLEVAGSSYVSELDELENPDDDAYDGGYNTFYHRPQAVGYGGGAEKGKSFNHNIHQAKGEKGGKGHKSHESYEKGHSEKHGHEENKGGKTEESGEKTGHLDEENHYAKGHNFHKGGKAEEKEQSKGHKKGKKTKGFRTVHHKDEYKKDEIFYDEEHDAGHHKGHGHEEAEHKHTKGGVTKKGHLKSGYKDAHKGFKGDKEEGHSYKTSKGFDGHKGHKAHQGHKSHYAKGEGHAQGEKHSQGGRGFY